MVSRIDRIMALLAQVEERIDSIQALVLADHAAPISAREAAARLEVSYEWLLLPWNVPEWKRAGTRFPEADWRAWIESSEDERRQTWDFMGKRDRRESA